MITAERKIYIVGDIDHDAYRRFTKHLTRLESESKEQIHIVLCSEGGNAQVALAFYDRIKMSACPISICGTGLVASAAALILVAPAKENRFMTSSSWLMVHDDNIGTEVNDHRIIHAERKIRQFRRFEQQWNELMAAATNIRAEIWDNMHKKESFITAQNCLSLGIIGEII